MKLDKNEVYYAKTRTVSGIEYHKMYYDYEVELWKVLVNNRRVYFRCIDFFSSDIRSITQEEYTEGITLLELLK